MAFALAWSHFTWADSHPDNEQVRERAQARWETLKVTMMVDYRVPRLGVGNQRVIEETWLLIDGRWWLHQPV